MDIGKNIAMVREELHLTQAQVAQRMNSSPSNYTRFEKRQNGISFEKLLEICTALGVEVCQVINYNPEVGLSSLDKSESKKLLREMNEIAKELADTSQVLNLYDEVLKNVLTNFALVIKNYIENILLLNNRIRREIFQHYAQTDNKAVIDNTTSKEQIFNIIWRYIKTELYFIPQEELRKESQAFDLVRHLKTGLTSYLETVTIKIDKEQAEFWKPGSKKEKIDWYKAEIYKQKEY